MRQRITYVGHASVLIELGDVRLLTDPMLRSHLLGVIRRQPPVPASEVSADIDAVLISHLHPDHLDFPSLRRIGRGTRVILPAGGGPTLYRRGFRTFTQLAPGDATEIGGVEISAVPAAHEGRRYKVGPAVEALGYVLRGAGRSIYFAGDTDLFAGMRDLAGGLDVALLPIGGWGPTLNPGHLDPQKAAEAAAILRPRVAVPIHWGTLVRADLPRRRPDLLSEPPRQFLARAAELAPGVDVRVLEPGESMSLAD